MRTMLTPLAAAVVLVSSACQMSTEAGSGDSVLLPAFESTPLAMSNVSSTFSDAAAEQDSTPWGPRGQPGQGPGRRGPHRGPLGFMMGGGLGDAFLGIGFGPRFGHRPPGDGDPLARCVYNTGTGRVECDAETRHGLTIVRSASFQDASGATQTGFDSATTNTINTRIRVTGTLTRRDGATSEVDNESDRTVSGLAQGSTQRTVNGTSRGHESTSGTNDGGAFTAERTAGDTIQNVVIPVVDGKPSYPTAGTIVRSMQVVLTVVGGAPTTSSRREVITFDGSETATIVITHDGVTRTCQLPLPRGRPNCS